MLSLTNMLDATQARWPLLPSLAIVGISDTLPLWAVAAAQRIALDVHPASVVACRVNLQRRADQLAALHRRWVVAAVLAVLLAMAVVANTSGVPLDSLHIGILLAVLSSILLPPLAICNGIARDYVAARALIAALNGAVRETAVQRVS